ncbi:MAG: metallophosphoesterase family protein [Erysipelotrichaceae bacterium]|nr:metallophosphoesterase family protein [Erysipelotrichaceae bacterium]
MKILVCSDSHGNNQALEEIVKKYPHCDLYLHAGDSESEELALFPFETVKGNGDIGFEMFERRILSTPYGKILMQHMPRIPYAIIHKYQIKIFIYGHTHRRYYGEEDGLIILNPGAISFPRDHYDLSFAILNIDEQHVEVEFHSLLDK